jgi:hypothetical protein
LKKARLFLALVGILVHAAASRQLTTREQFVKHEYKVPMRDGVKLFTTVYVPRDASQAYPIILTRTPYSCAPYGEENYRGGMYPRELENADYIFVYQDVRGRYMSEGDWVELRPHNPNKRSAKETDESSDTYDTVEWLLKNIPRNNGKVGVGGISYPGFYASLATIDAHARVLAVSPQAPIADDFIGDDDHHNGALFLTAAFGFYAHFGWPRPIPLTEYPSRFKFPTLDGYKFFLELGPLSNANKFYFHDSVGYWNDMMNHGTYDDYWKKLNVLPHLKNIRPNVLIVGGWFDAEDLYGPLKTYRELVKNNPTTGVRLVMGPWSHGQWASSDGSKLGDARFGSNTAEFFQQNIEKPFFEYHLRGVQPHPDTKVTVFQTGANEWRTFAAWPPKERTLRNLYLAELSSLSFNPPAGKTNVHDEYVSDPMNPVPFTKQITTGFPKTYMVEDQRFASRRPDVLVFQTAPLKENLTIAGPIIPSLFVSTSGTDADWIVKVIDVFPEAGEEEQMSGYEMLIRGDVMRGKFRNSFSKPEAFVPNQPTKVEFELQDVFHTFRKGHRLMVQIHSSWFPLVDRNPGKFVDIYEATESDFQKTTQRVYRSHKYPTHLTIGVLE